jgi:hypothetical protein
MNKEHPITPPPQLVQQWHCEENGFFAEHIATQAARWGADQELEACCVEVAWLESSETAKRMRERRRPEPPSLKEQALDALREAESTGCLYVNGRSDLIRRALEALPND